MNILFLDWGAFGKEPAIEAFHQLGHRTFLFKHQDYQSRSSESFGRDFHAFIEANSIDICFSFNFYPLMAEACHSNNLKYISYVYDNPLVNLFSYKIIYPTNYIFVFDSYLVESMNRGGIETIYYAPLAANPYPEHLETLSDTDRLSATVSFVGALYNEDHNFYDRLKNISPYTRGYLEGIMAAQHHIYGMNFLEDLLVSDIVNDMYRDCPYDPNSDGVQTREYVYAHYFLNRKLTERERLEYLTALGSKFDVSLYTLDGGANLPGIKNCGPVEYYHEMPYVFHHSAINLNITLRSIVNGIPLRAFDIMAAGGFLLTNYQSDFLRHFVPNQDFVYFESREDLLDKTAYYLDHPKLRQEISHNALEKIKKEHTFLIRLGALLDFALGH